MSKRALDEEETPQKRQEGDGDFMGHLRFFYRRLFPFDCMYQWLSYGNGMTSMHDGTNISDADTFYHREFSFTIPNDTYIRYLCFSREEEFKAV